MAVSFTTGCPGRPVGEGASLDSTDQMLAVMLEKCGVGPGWDNSTLTAWNKLTPDLGIFRVRPDGSLFDFVPGQYAVIGLPAGTPRCESADPEEAKDRNPGKLIRRPYSIASSSMVKEYLELYINLVRSGALTPRLWMLEPGDRMWLGPKAKGHFSMHDLPANKHIVLVGTGTGLAPYMSMIRDHFRGSTDRRFVVVHGARYVHDLGYRSELDALDRNSNALAYIPTITKPEAYEQWKGHTGRVQSVFKDGTLEAALGETLSPETTHVFLAGNPEMIEDMESRLVETGFKPHSVRSPGTLHVERYW